MNIFNKVTVRSLKKNRVRTIVTIIGIILSTAMICAVTTFVSSMQNYALQYAVYKLGDWHGMAADVSVQTYENIAASKEVENVSYAQLLGYAEIGSNNEEKPYLYVMGGDTDSFFTMFPVHMISGELPKNSSEIILPEHLESNGGVTYQIGDKVLLELGERMYNGASLGQKDAYCNGDTENVNKESIEVHDKREYTVVGFYERLNYELESYSAPGYTALTVVDSDITDDMCFNVYFNLTKPSKIYSFMSTMNIGDTVNSDVLLYSGVSRFDNFKAMLVGLASIVIALIMFGSISLIYNAFSISVSERTKQFGLLLSIGATKKQLRKTVLFEAIAVSVIGIPIGILAGIGGIGITLKIIGGMFFSMMGGSFDLPLRICVSYQSILIAIVVALVTVLISAWIPSKRATKVSAVEAIRQNADIKADRKKLKTSKLTYKVFGLPGVLANKYYKRSKRKYRTTVVSLFMSIVLFVSASAFTSYLMESVSGGFSSNQYDLMYYLKDFRSLNGKTYDEVLDLLKSDTSVSRGAFVARFAFSGAISDSYLTDKFKDSRVTAEYSDEVYIENGEKTEIYAFIYFVDDAEFKTLLDENGLNSDEFENPDTPVGISLDYSVQFDPMKEKYVSMNTLKGDECEITFAVNKEIEGYYYYGYDSEATLPECYRYQNINDENDNLMMNFEQSHFSFTAKTIKKITDNTFYTSQSDQVDLKLIYPISVMEKVLPDNDEVKKDAYSGFFLLSDNHAASHQNLSDVLMQNGLNKEALIDQAENEEINRNFVTIVRVFAYGFIVLISLIAAANVFNTISTNISLRRREFAMLKSVGMTTRDFNRMMNYECLLYGFRALLSGIPVSVGITYLIYRAVTSGYETGFRLPWSAMGIATVSVFAVVFVTMLYSMSKIKKDNPIDALKNENL